jgi:hypothetical protein
MAYKLVGKHRRVIEDFDDIDGKGGDLRKHHPPQRVGGLEVEVLDDEVGALVVGLNTAMLVDKSRPTKRAVYL